MVTRKANICPIGHEKSRVPALDFFCIIKVLEGLPSWIIKVLEGLPNLLRVFREGLAKKIVDVCPVSWTNF